MSYDILWTKSMTHYVWSFFASRTLCGRKEEEIGEYVELAKLEAYQPHICTECYEEAWYDDARKEYELGHF
mgnify:CR=1 FL=1